MEAFYVGRVVGHEGTAHRQMHIAKPKASTHIEMLTLALTENSMIQTDWDPKISHSHYSQTQFRIACAAESKRLLASQRKARFHLPTSNKPWPGSNVWFFRNYLFTFVPLFILFLYEWEFVCCFLYLPLPTSSRTIVFSTSQIGILLILRWCLYARLEAEQFIFLYINYMRTTTIITDNVFVTGGKLKKTLESLRTTINV